MMMMMMTMMMMMMMMITAKIIVMLTTTTTWWQALNIYKATGTGFGFSFSVSANETDFSEYTNGNRPTAPSSSSLVPKSQDPLGDDDSGSFRRLVWSDQISPNDL